MIFVVCNRDLTEEQERKAVDVQSQSPEKANPPAHLPPRITTSPHKKEKNNTKWPCS